MSSESKGQAFNIVTVSGGTVVEKTASGLLDKDRSSDKAQHWTLEYDGDSENKVAFQNASNGQYLSCTSGAAYGKIDTSTSKQWWTLEEGRAPGSYWIKSNDFPNAYLCNANGSYGNNNKLNWTHALTWYLKDANADGFKPPGYIAVGAQAGGQSGGLDAEEMKKKEEALAKREQDLADAEAAQKEKSEQLEAKKQELKELSEKQQSTSKSDSNAAEAFKKREEELAKKEDDQKKQAEQLEAKDKELKELADKQQRTSKSDDSASKDLKKREDELAKKEQDQKKQSEQLEAKEKELADKQQSASKPDDDASGDLKKREEELAKKEQDQKKQAKQLEAKEKELEELAEKQQNATSSDDDASGQSKKLADQQADVQRQLDEMQSKERELASREAAAADKEKQATETAEKLKKQTSDKETELQQKEQELAQKEKDLAGTSARRDSAGQDSDALKGEVAHLNYQLEQLRKQMDAAVVPVPGATGTSADAEEVAKVKAENARLKDLVSQLALQLNDAQKQQRPRKLATAKASSVNGSVTPTTKGPTPASKPSVPAAQTAGQSPATPQQTNGAASSTTAKPSPPKLAQKPASSKASTAPIKPSTGANISNKRTPSSATTAPSATTSPPKAQPSRQAQKLSSQTPSNGPKQSTPKTGSAPTRSDDEIERLKREIELLKSSSAEATNASAGSNKGGPKVDSTHDDEIVFDCGHVLHAPPRKVHKRVVGILYER